MRTSIGSHFFKPALLEAEIKFLTRARYLEGAHQSRMDPGAKLSCPAEGTPGVLSCRHGKTCVVVSSGIPQCNGTSASSSTAEGGISSGTAKPQDRHRHGSKSELGAKQQMQ